MGVRWARRTLEFIFAYVNGRSWVDDGGFEIVDHYYYCCGWACKVVRVFGYLGAFLPNTASAASE